MQTEFQVFQVNPFQENTWLVSHNHRAVVVDPGFMSASEIQPFLNQLQEKNLVLEAILLTHAHLDHIFGIDKVLGRFDIPVYLHPEDLIFWENYMSTAAMYGFQVQPFAFEPLPILPQKNFEVAGMKMDVLFTPGHAPGHVAYYFEEAGVVVSGDALFRESVGRTDLPKGDFSVLESSIRSKLYILPEETRVLPGHGPETTIGYEKRFNPFVKAV